MQGMKFEHNEMNKAQGFRLSYGLAMALGFIVTLLVLQLPALANESDAGPRASLAQRVDPYLDDMAFTTVSDEKSGREIVIRGEGLFSATTDVVFERFLDRHALAEFATDRHGKRAVRLQLHSRGGDLFAALRFGRLLRDKGYRVSVKADDDCLSACAFAFLGGHDRQAASGVLGVHSFALRVRKGGDVSFKALSDTRAAIVTSLLEGYFRDMGIDQALLQTALDTPHDAMTYLSRDLLLRTGALMPAQDRTPAMASDEAWDLRLERL